MQNKRNGTSKHYSCANDLAAPDLVAALEAAPGAAAPAAKPAASRPLIRRGCSFVLSATLAAALSCMTPAAALASDADVAADWASAAAQLDDGSYQPRNFATGDGVSSLASAIAEDTGSFEPLKAKYDLRDPDGDGDRSDSVVTPVKSQGMWGTCWAFASIAASETSILSELGLTAAQTGLDLSELNIASSVYRNDGAPESVVGAAQAGEGFRNDSDEVNLGLNMGGAPVFCSSVFAMGIGLLPEEDAPYRNADGTQLCLVSSIPGENAIYAYLNDYEIAQYKLSGATVEPYGYAGDYLGQDGSWVRGDWSVDDGLWDDSAYALENGNILPEAVNRDSDGNYVSTNKDAIMAAKGEMQYYGRAISMGYYYSPEYEDNANSAYYSYDSHSTNHIVAIVGWDDDYAASNFSDDPAKQPPENGAWLVKNSWGAETEEYPNSGTYGVVEDGKATGYFWLSYYDKSLAGFESFDFDVDSYGDGEACYAEQYDYMPEGSVIELVTDAPASTANIFTAEGDMSLRTLGGITCKPNTTVTYQVYLLDDEAATPTDPGHSKLVCSFDETYQYGGYHRATLAEGDWIAMRSGQRYAVVTTQRCNDDGKWYQGATVNCAPYGTAARDSLLESAKGSIKNAYTYSYFKKYYEEHRAQGADAQTAINLAHSETATKLQEDDVVASIQKQAETYVDAQIDATFIAKVNAGESWTGETAASDAAVNAAGGAGASGATEWSDWTVVKEAVEQRAPGYAADNASVKAFSEVRDWASVGELDSLSVALSAAKGVLDAASVSADGSDVYACDTWMTQAEHDAAAAAVAAAEKLLDAAGDYHDSLANTTPSSDDVAAAAAALAFEAHAGSKAVPTFPDVDYSEGSWYADSVGWCAAHGLLEGYPDGRFGVGDGMQRAMLATVLWRHFEPDAAAAYTAEVQAGTKGTSAADGVEDAQYYTAAANWAVSAGVVQGFEVEGQDRRDFTPYGELSFEQLVSVLAKASGADYESSDLSALDKFADKDSVSDWAAHAMAWAVEEGLVSGWDNGADNMRELKPAETVARERVAVVLANAFAAGVLL